MNLPRGWFTMRLWLALRDSWWHMHWALRREICSRSSALTGEKSSDIKDDVDEMEGGDSPNDDDGDGDKKDDDDVL